MATVPLSGTNIRLLTGIPFSNDYKHTRWFDSKSQQTTWFTNRTAVHTIPQATYQRQTDRTYIRCNKSIDDLYGVNYLMFQNAQYSNKWFYAFVTELEYVNRAVTNIHFEIDVLQTWRFDYTFKPSFVKREHCPLWNNDGTPVVNTIDEGLDYGSEYEIVKVDNYVPFDDLFFLVIISKSLMHTSGDKKPKDIQASLNGMPQPLSYYIHPFRTNGSVPAVDGMQELSSLTSLLSNIFSQDDAVNNIVNMYVTDYIGLNPSYDGETLTFDGDHVEFAGITDDVNGNVNTIYLKKLTQYFHKDYAMGTKYSGFHSVSESKLLMYPYTVLTLTDFKGGQADFKLEYIHNDNISLKVEAGVGTSNKVTYKIIDYLTNNLENDSSKGWVTLQNALISDNPQDVAIITDMLSAYLQGNRNSLANQSDSIIFNGFMNAIGNTIGGVASASSGSVPGVASSATGLVTGGGNTVLELQGLEAKKQDINNTPPQLSRMGNNTAYSFGNGYKGVYLIKKQITQEYREKLSHFFRMFGYKVNKVKIPNFHTRVAWNYVQTSSCIITGNFNNNDLTELKSIFDNGITLWHVDDVGNYEIENGVL